MAWLKVFFLFQSSQISQGLSSFLLTEFKDLVSPTDDL